MAPPLSPEELTAWVEVRVTFAPVATGATKGTVVVGETVAITTTSVEEVGRRGAE